MEEGNSSPLQAESIRSPMNAASPVSMVIGTPEPEVKISPLIFPLKEETVKSESKKKKASAPGSASKKAKTSEGTPAKSPSKPKDGESATKPTTEKKKSGASSAAKKKKIENLMALEAEILANLEKLKKDKSKIQSKIKATDEATMKYPVKDELLFDPKNVRGKPRKTLPLPSMHMDQYISDDIANDTLLVWDFLNVFSKQLSLHEISLEDFTALMKFTGHESVALSEIFCALLKLILSDSKLLDKLNLAIPRKVNFAYRSTSTGPDVSTVGTAADLEEQDELSIEQLNNLETFDNAYNGFKLLPRRIRADHVDLLRYQSILRCVLLRLEPVKRLRSSVSDITAALQSQYGLSQYAGSTLLASTMKRLNNIQSSSTNVIPASSSSNNLALAASAKTPMSVKFSKLLQKIDTPGAPRTAQSKAAAAASAAKRELTSEVMARINTPHKGPNKKAVTLDKDAIFRITADVTAPLETIIDAAAALETNELFMLSARHKVAILKVLCDACYDTSRIVQLLENHAEERANRILALNKQNRDAKQKQKELNMAKRDKALELCRAANKAAAIAKLTVTTASGRKSLGGSGASGKSPSAKSAAAGATGDSKTGSDAPKDGSKKSSGGGSKKDPLEPSQEQLNNMIDELVLLEKVGVDEVVDDLQPEVISDSEPEEGGGDGDEDEFVVVDGDYVKSRRPRRNLAQSRVKSAEKQRIREEKKYFNDTLEIAHMKINNALERNNEREIRSAIKAGEKSGLRFEKRGKVYCTQKLKQCYKLLNDLETKAEEDRVANQHERALQEYFVRTSPIGSDRFHNQYWSFVGDERLFVQVREEIPPAERTGLIPPSHSNSVEGDVLNHLYHSRPNRYRYKWSIYSSMSEYWHLWDALDDRGEREAELKAVVKARFEVEEPPPVYLPVGSEYIGRKVKRTFGNKRVVYGSIVGWLPQSGEDVALWHIVHSDGDEEDLELHEVLDCLVPEEQQQQPSDVSSPLVKVASRASLRTAASNNSLVDLSTPVKASEGAAVAVVDSGNSSREIDLLPRMIRNNTSLLRGSVRNNASNIGTSGMKFELNKILTQMNEVLKRLNGALSREDRKVWENTVRAAETADDLKAPLLELEQLVRSVQKPEDKRDAEEEKKRRDAERAEMLTEGWVFDANTIEVLGSKARRFFKGFGKSDGIIVGYLPAEKNDGLALYHMEHTDGDVEDLEEADVFKAIQRYVDDVREDDEPEDESDNEDEEGSSDEEEDGGDSEDEEEDGNYHTLDSEAGPYTSTLWPTHEVRQRWREAVQRLHTVGELALAVHAFVEYVTMFGVIVPDDEEGGADAKAVSGSRVRKQATMFSPAGKNKPSSNSNSSSRGGGGHQSSSRVVGNVTDLGKRTRTVVDRSHFSPEKRMKSSRAAARRPISYAE